MKVFAFALLLGCAASASAQLLRLPQLPPSAPPPPPGPTEGSSDEPSARSTISRKMEVLEVAGLTVPPSGLQESVTLTARRTWINPRTFVDFAFAKGYSTRNNYVVVEAVPQVTLAFAPKRPHAELVWNADPTKRHIIDCEVGGPATQIKFRWSDDSGEASATISRGRVSTVLPTGVAGSVKLSADKDWRFHSCEITPVAI